MKVLFVIVGDLVIEFPQAGARAIRDNVDIIVRDSENQTIGQFLREKVDGWWYEETEEDDA